MPSYNKGNQTGKKPGQSQQPETGSKPGATKSPAAGSQKSSQTWSKEKPMAPEKKR